jgi:glycosyltransferase involved in cell wall biosynthesis
VSRRLRVVVMVESVTGPWAGGAEHVAARIAINLDRERFHPTLCTTRLIDPTGPLLTQLHDAGVPVLQLQRRRRLDLGAWRPLIELLRREQVDILHSHLFGANVWGGILGRLARVPVVIAHEHSWTFEGRPLRRFLDRELIARTSTVVAAVSTEDKEKMIEVERIPPDKIRVLPNGIPPLSARAGHDLRDELGIPAEAPLVGSVGELHPQKAFDVLIGAVAELRQRVPAAQLVIAGGGNDRPRLEEVIRRRGLAGAAHLLGRRDDVPDVLAALDVAVCCSDREGSPLSVMEYMAAGLPIVATRIGGIPDLIDDGVHGLLVPPRNEHALSSALERVLTDDRLRSRLGDAARERQEREFRLEDAIRRVEALYEELAAAASSTKAAIRSN